MNRSLPVNRALLNILLVAVIAIAGCLSTPLKDQAADLAQYTQASSGRAGNEDAFVDMAILNWVFGVCVALAVAAIIATAMRLPTPPKLTASLLACAIGAAVLKVVLVKYAWVMGLVAAVGIMVAAAVFVMTHIAYFERKTGIDINRDGKIGEKRKGK